ncbi:MAG TPA: DUF2971 domain-containing protein [Allosphingosinicella sp.]|jgi:hypothetical protein
MVSWKDRFDDIEVRWFDDAYLSNASSVPSVLYHYTDAAGLMGMLKGGKVWATDYRFLNDKSEVGHSKAIIREILADRLKGSGSDDLKKLYAEILAYQDMDPVEDPFLFSFSEDPDDLSQWRGYARDGQGFTIGFCGPTLYALALPEEAHFGLIKVEYVHDRQKEIFQRILSEIEGELTSALTGRRSRRADCITYAAEAFDGAVDTRAVLNKHRSFRSEREWRLISVVAIDDPDREQRVRSRGSRLVRYVELPMDAPEPGKLPIKRIGVGPGFVGTEDVHAVRALCRDAGYSPEIYFAETPYRRV